MDRRKEIPSHMLIIAPKTEEEKLEHEGAAVTLGKFMTDKDAIEYAINHYNISDGDKVVRIVAIGEAILREYK